MRRSKLDDWIEEWARWEVAQSLKSNYPGINAVEKILRDPGFSGGGGRDRVHWWPKNRRMSKMSRAMHQLDKISQLVLIIDAGQISRDDGTTFTEYDLARCSSIDKRRFHEIKNRGKRKIKEILWR